MRKKSIVGRGKIRKGVIVASPNFSPLMGENKRGGEKYD